MRHYLLRKFDSVLLIFFVLFSLACSDESSFSLKVVVKDGQGKALKNAEVTLNEKKLGKTNHLGVFTSKVKVPFQDSYYIEVIKDSEIAYYAPFLKELAQDDLSQEQVKVDAVLYSVPKWSYDFQETETDAGEEQGNSTTETSTVREKTNPKPPNAIVAMPSRAANENVALTKSYKEDGKKPKEVAEKSKTSKTLSKIKEKQSEANETWQIVVKDQNGNLVSGVNIYRSEKWIGKTNKKGVMEVSSKKGNLRASKSGFQEARFNYKSATTLISLTKIKSFISVDSEPRGALVYFDGIKYGETPFSKSKPLKPGFIKMELSGPVGFKKFTSVLELEEGTLNLTGSSKIVLEKDFIKKSDALIKDGKIEAAIKCLESVPSNHSDFTYAWHRLGEIHLTLKDDPSRSRKAFQAVVSVPDVKRFQNKKFLTSHVDLAIATFYVAEMNASRDEKNSSLLFGEAYERLKKVTPYFRFLDESKHDQIVDAAKFYQALSLQRIWQFSQNDAIRVKAKDHWSSYLSTTDSSKGWNRQADARVYLKQLQRLGKRSA